MASPAAPVIGRHRSPDSIARQMIEEHRRNAFATAFKGTKLVKKGSKSKEDAKEIAAAVRDVTSTVLAAGSVLPDASDFLDTAGPAFDCVLKLLGLDEDEQANFQLVMAEELAVLTLKTGMSVAGMLVPYFSTAVLGVSMLKQWGEAATEGYKAYSLKRTIGSDVLPGDPQQAAKAVRQLIKRNSANSARLATISTVKFTVDVAATAGGFGVGGAIAAPVTGAAASAAQLANSLFLLGRDYREMTASNALLTASQLPSAEILFGAFPVLGCYLIAGADDSDLLFFLAKDMGKGDWMTEVERMKKTTLGPLQEAARDFIENSRYELDGFHGSKISIKKGFSKKKSVSPLGIIKRLF
jgi:hypothetical protein